jgi:hypothetical protein
VNGGESFTPLAPTSIDDFAVMANSTIEIAGFSPTDANVVYARVTLADNSQSDALYRSDDGGTSWTKLFEKRDSLSFLVRANGDLVAATQQVTDTSCDAMATDCFGAFVSKNGGQTWTALPSPPHITCLEENGAGEVWACTQNYGIPGVPKDGFGIMKASGELQAWTGVMKYQEIAAPVACSSGTVQNDQCNAKLWCGLCAQLACDPQRDCPAEVEVDGPPPDAPSMVVTPPQDSCCGSSHGGSSLLLGGLVGILLSRRRRALVPHRAPTRR